MCSVSEERTRAGYHENKSIICGLYELSSSDSDCGNNPPKNDKACTHMVMLLNGRYRCLVTANCSSYHILSVIDLYATLLIWQLLCACVRGDKEKA